jgi:hypothetical protein
LIATGWCLSDRHPSRWQAAHEPKPRGAAENSAISGQFLRSAVPNSVSIQCLTGIRSLPEDSKRHRRSSTARHGSTVVRFEGNSEGTSN